MNKRFLVDITILFGISILAVVTIYMVYMVFESPEHFVKRECAKQMPDFMSTVEKGNYCSCAANTLSKKDYSADQMQTQEGRREFFNLLKDCNGEYFEPIAHRNCRSKEYLPQYVKDAGVEFDCSCFSSLTQSLYIENGDYSGLDGSASLACTKVGQKYFQSTEDIRKFVCMRDVRFEFGLKLSSLERLKIDAYCACHDKMNIKTKIYANDGLTVRDMRVYDANKIRCRLQHL